MPERERVIEAAAAVASVFVMLVTMLYIGQTYGTDVSLGEDGAPVLIAAIIGFVVFVTVVGVALAYTTSDPTPPDEDADAAA